MNPGKREGWSSTQRSSRRGEGDARRKAAFAEACCQGGDSGDRKGQRALSPFPRPPDLPLPECHPFMSLPALVTGEEAGRLGLGWGERSNQAATLWRPGSADGRRGKGLRKEERGRGKGAG